MPLTKKDIARTKGTIHNNNRNNDAIKNRPVYRDEFEEMLRRLTLVEKKLGIKK